MTFFLGQVSTGVLVGSIYALVAVGFVVIYKTTSIFNFAQGDLVALGAYVGWVFISELGLPLWAALFLGLAVGLILGALIERFTLRPMVGQPMLSLVMLTLALGILIRAITLLIWKARVKAYPPTFPMTPLTVGEIVFPYPLLFAFAISIVLVVLLSLFFRYTKIGLGMRAVAADHQLARSVGIPIRWIVALSWGIGVMAALITGNLLGGITSASMVMSEVGFKAIAVALVGGLESVMGAVLAGLLMGVLEALAVGYIGHGIGTVFSFAILILMLMIRPYGLFGLKRVERI